MIFLLLLSFSVHILIILHIVLCISCCIGLHWCFRSIFFATMTVTIGSWIMTVLLFCHFRLTDCCLLVIRFWCKIDGYNLNAALGFRRWRVIAHRMEKLGRCHHWQFISVGPDSVIIHLWIFCSVQMRRTRTWNIAQRSRDRQIDT